LHVHVSDLFRSSITRVTTSEAKITATPASAQKSRPGAKPSNIARAHPTSAPTKTFAVDPENSLSLFTTRAYPAMNIRSCHSLVRPCAIAKDVRLVPQSGRHDWNRLARPRHATCPRRRAGRGAPGRLTGHQRSATGPFKRSHRTRTRPTRHLRQAPQSRPRCPSHHETEARPQERRG